MADSDVGEFGYIAVVIFLLFILTIKIIIKQSQARALAAAASSVSEPQSRTAATPNERAIHNINLHQVTVVQTTAIPSAHSHFPNSSILFPRVGEIRLTRQQSSVDLPPAYIEVVDPHLHPPSYETSVQMS